MDTSTEAEITTWVASSSYAAAQLKATAAGRAQTLWEQFQDWYSTALVAALAAEVANLSQAAQDATQGLYGQYVANVIAALRGTSVQIPSIDLPPVRNGVDLSLVHTRPAEAYRRAIAVGKTEDQARQAAVLRAGGLVTSDILLVGRSTQVETMRGLDVARYRRVIRPELSETGTCGLCIAASDRIYRRGDLMPIHPPSCQCTTLPIVGDDDPGLSLNREDLERLYADAGSTAADDLRKTRYTVNEHGEFGPVLTKAGDAFRGPTEVALEDDPDRAARMLDKLLPVLDTLEQRAAAGEDVSGPLAYQRNLVARLRRITESAA
ncbi:hypothetical protein [Mumia sp. DW29H23]|uniref:hypothetical protein n=1 Tax=Mumia sp. DW29H23 TaxID=3421241 RepID=UPI003D693BEC